MQEFSWLVDSENEASLVGPDTDSMPVRDGRAVLDGEVQPIGLLQNQSLKIDPEDLSTLGITLTLTNSATVPTDCVVRVESQLLPSALFNRTVADFPIATYVDAYHPVLAFLGPKADPRAQIDVGVAGSFEAFYLEPAASRPEVRTTERPLLVPLVQWFQQGVALRTTLFADLELPWCFRYESFLSDRLPVWSATTQVQLAAHETREVKAWLNVADDDGRQGWAAFHQHAAPSLGPAASWPAQTQVHYYDYLSAEQPGKPRGGGYDVDVAHFKRFGVGMATQHAYYPSIGDFIRPDRERWQAMRGTGCVPAEMSLQLMRDRVARTRAAGSRATVYIHQALFDSSSDLYPALRDEVMVGPDGHRIAFPWSGPDTVGQNFHMSMASPVWQEHLLDQVRLIMELIDPDGIVIDETFAGLGYDYHPDRRGPVSAHMIRFIKRMRELVRSFGDDKALFSSDCGYSSFGLWCDGEAGDHAYGGILGQPLYRREIGGYASVLGPRRWLPGAWHWTYHWEDQMDLARRCGAGVGVSNGWYEYTGLSRVPKSIENRILEDIRTLPGMSNR